MGDCVDISLNNQTFKSDAVIIGSNSKQAAVAGLTVYGDISASGRIYGTDSGFSTTTIIADGGFQYPLSFHPSANAQDYLVSVDGVIQEAGNSFFVSTAGMLTFTENVAAGSRIIVVTIRAVLANSTNVPTFKKNKIYTTSTVLTYGLTWYSNDNPNNYLAFLDGVMQNPGEDFTISGSSIVLATNPATGQTLLVMSLQNSDGTYATMQGTSNIVSFSGIPMPTGALDSHSLVYDSSISQWVPRYVIPRTATDGQVLTYSTNSAAWTAQTLATSRGGGITIFDSPGSNSWTVPSNVGGIRVHVLGAGGGISNNGGDSSFNITVNGIPVIVTAKGGGVGTTNKGGKGGDVVAVAANSTIKFTGVGSGIGGEGGALGYKGEPGTGISGGYGGGGGGGSGGGFIAFDTTPVGSISWYTAASVPGGYLECNGAVISQITYADLYSILGSTFNTGGEGTGNFRLPDLRGEFIRGWDHAKGVDTGRTLGSKQTDSMQNIAGSFAVGGTEGGVHSPTGPFYDTGSRVGNWGTGHNNNATNPYVGFDASRQVRTSAETRPRNIALLPCIKAVKTAPNPTINSAGGGGGGCGVGGGGGGGISGTGGNGAGYGGSGSSDVSWEGKSGGYGGGAASAGSAAGGGGGYAVFSLEVVPGSIAYVTTGAGGTGGTKGSPGAVIIEW